MLRVQCGDDWRRITHDGNGGFVVHNQPQPDSLPALPALPAPSAPPTPRPTPATIAPPVFRGRPGKPRHPPGFKLVNPNGILIKPRTKPTARKRSGVPRSAIELTKRLLDLECQFERIPKGTKACVYYYGYVIGTVWVADNTPRRVLTRDYQRIRLAIEAINNHFADDE